MLLILCGLVKKRSPFLLLPLFFFIRSLLFCLVSCLAELYLKGANFKHGQILGVKVYGKEKK